ncbi:MAG: hypothetical protein H0U64_00770 [Gemmatimonadaceae bacterium]|nr:hypothetical protein [Gemmatimonadaceae bacterium]
MNSAPDVLVTFDEVVQDESGATYITRVVGAETSLGQWEGWLEFTPEKARGDVITTERETTQPNRVDLRYWATGLSRVFIEGSLKRAIDNVSSGPVLRAEAPPRSAAPHKPRRTPPLDSRTPVLDPFSVYLQGEDILRQQLAALSIEHMRTLIDAYQLDVGTIAAGTSNTGLAEKIVSAVRALRAS